MCGRSVLLLSIDNITHDPTYNIGTDRVTYSVTISCANSLSNHIIADSSTDNITDSVSYRNSTNNTVPNDITDDNITDHLSYSVTNRITIHLTNINSNIVSNNTVSYNFANTATNIIALHIANSVSNCLSIKSVSYNLTDSVADYLAYHCNHCRTCFSMHRGRRLWMLPDCIWVDWYLHNCVCFIGTGLRVPMSCTNHMRRL